MPQSLRFASLRSDGKAGLVGFHPPKNPPRNVPQSSRFMANRKQSKALI